MYLSVTRRSLSALRTCNLSQPVRDVSVLRPSAAVLYVNTATFEREVRCLIPDGLYPAASPHLDCADIPYRNFRVR
jgi:hypothetical protein